MNWLGVRPYWRYSAVNVLPAQSPTTIVPTSTISPWFLGDPPFTKGQEFGRQHPHSFQALKRPSLPALASLPTKSQAGAHFLAAKRHPFLLFALIADSIHSFLPGVTRADNTTMTLLCVGLQVTARQVNSLTFLSFLSQVSYPKCGQEWDEDDSSDVSEPSLNSLPRF
jgi:hypothetical protein